MTSYIDDMKLIEMCRNSSDNRCGCIFPPKNIIVFSKSSYSPYYCWYGPCLDDNAYKTSLIKEEQTLCNITTCQVSLGDVVLESGNLTVNNDCASIVNPLVKFSQTIGSFQNFFFSFLIVDFSYFYIIIVLIIILIYNI